MPEVLLPSGLYVAPRFAPAAPQPAGGLVDTKGNRITESTYRSNIGMPDWSATSKFRDYSAYLGAIRIPWVWACVSVIAYNFASTPLQEWEDDDVVDDEEDDPLAQLMERPNSTQTGMQWKELLAMYLELTGNAYITLEDRDPDGRPRQMFLPNPARMRIKPGPDGVEGYVYDAGVTATGSMSNAVFYAPDEVLHIRMANVLDDWYGMGNIEACVSLLDIITSMATQELSYWQSGGRIVGVLETENKLTDEDFRRLKREWQMSNADKKQRVRTAILEQGLKYTPIGEGFRSLDLVNIDKGKRDQVLAVFGVPLPKLGIMEQAQYKMDEADAFFWQETLHPKFDRFEDSIIPLVDLFNPNRRLQFERKTFEDDQYKLQNAQALVSSGLGLVDEGRALIGLDPLPNGNGQVLMLSNGYSVVPVGGLQHLAALTIEGAEAPPPGIAGPSMEPDDGETVDGEVVDGEVDDTEDNTVHLSDHLKALRQEERAYIAALELRRRQAKAAVARRRGKAASLPSNPMQRANLAAKRIGAGGKLPPRTTTTSTVHPATVLVLRRKRDAAVSELTDGARQRVRAAFREQQAAMTDRWQNFTAALKHPTPEKRAGALRALLDPAPMGEALAGVWAASAGRAVPVALDALPLAARAPKARRAPQTKAPSPTPGMEVQRPVPPGLERLDLPPALEAYRGRLGDAIVRDWQMIDDTTFRAIQDAVDEGLRRGYGPLQIANGVSAEGYDGIAGAFGPSKIDYRTDMIARTELMRSYNWSQAQAWGAAGVQQVYADDGVEDGPCSDRNGTLYLIDPNTGEIMDNGNGVQDHPNGTLMFIPDAQSITGNWLDAPAPDDFFGPPGRAGRYEGE